MINIYMQDIFWNNFLPARKAAIRYWSGQ